MTSSLDAARDSDRWAALPATSGWYVKDKTLRWGEGHERYEHAVAVLTLVLHGRLDETFQVGRQRCSGWELQYKPLGEPHETSAGPVGARMLLIGVNHEFLNALRLRVPARPCVLSSGTLAARSFGRLLALLRSREDATALAVETVTGILDAALRGSPGFRERPAWIEEVEQYVRSRCVRRWSLESLARRFRVHPGHLTKIFRKHYDTSIGSFRRRLRVDRAVEALGASSVPIVEVANELGYADQSHLSREFKFETGWSPGRFRREARSLSRLPA